jgi:hypothetical protein
MTSGMISHPIPKTPINVVAASARLLLTMIYSPRVMWTTTSFLVVEGALSSAHSLQVLRLKARVTRDPAQHSRANLVTVMEGEYEVRLPAPRENAVRACLALDGPTDAEECGENTAGLGGRP